jgi:hypothetical protein
MWASRWSRGWARRRGQQFRLQARVPAPSLSLSLSLSKSSVPPILASPVSRPVVMRTLLISGPTRPFSSAALGTFSIFRPIRCQSTAARQPTAVIEPPLAASNDEARRSLPLCPTLRRQASLPSPYTPETYHRKGEPGQLRCHKKFRNRLGSKTLYISSRYTRRSSCPL